MAIAAKVIDDALALAKADRAELAATLLRSLDDDLEEHADMVDAAWDAEIDRRIADREAGRAGATPLAAALAGISAQLAATRDPQNR